jgi:hypothetical protein
MVTNAIYRVVHSNDFTAHDLPRRGPRRSPSAATWGCGCSTPPSRPRRPPVRGLSLSRRTPAAMIIPWRLYAARDGIRVPPGCWGRKGTHRRLRGRRRERQEALGRHVLAPVSNGFKRVRTVLNSFKQTSPLACCAARKPASRPAAAGCGPSPARAARPAASPTA